MMNAD